MQIRLKLTREENAKAHRVATGNPASMYPVPGSTLLPKVALVATQSGTGDPSPVNVRPIVKALAAGGMLAIGHGDGTTSTPYTWAAPQDIYGLPGAETYVDWDKRELVVQDRVITPIAVGGTTDLGSVLRVYCTHTDGAPPGTPTTELAYSRCTHIKYGISYTADTEHWYISGSTVWLFVAKDRLTGSTAANVNAWIAANDVRVQTRRATPLRIPLSTLPSILALAQLDRYTPRQNYLTADIAGDTSHISGMMVGYAKSPIRTEIELTAAIAALGV